MLRMKEIFWKQKSRVNWLIDGDLNTKFFHSSTLVTRSRNSLVGIKDNKGSWLDDMKQIENHVVEHFSRLFSDTVNECDNESIRKLFPPVISVNENSNLTCHVSNKEIINSMNQLGSHKAPGPDRLQGFFFTKYWEHVGPSVVKLIKDFFINGQMNHRLNKTYIALIPKKVCPNTIKEYRPISLCNFVMKIITKIIANRLRPLLEKIISPNQHAFVSGRSIFDSTVICNEIIHSFKLKKGWMALKLDFDKAYDKVNWHFLFKILECLGFENKFIQWIQKCINTISFQMVWTAYK